MPKPISAVMLIASVFLPSSLYSNGLVYLEAFDFYVFQKSTAKITITYMDNCIFTIAEIFKYIFAILDKKYLDIKYSFFYISISNKINGIVLHQQFFQKFL